MEDFIGKVLRQKNAVRSMDAGTVSSRPLRLLGYFCSGLYLEGSTETIPRYKRFLDFRDEEKFVRNAR